MKSDEIIYSLTIEDIQTVALETLDRKPTKAEVKKIIEPIHTRLPWFDAIEDAITCTLK